MLVNTPYDDVFKTLSNDCKELLLPVINEVFQEHYNGDEEIIFHPNEHYLNQQNGTEQERITDTCFEVIGEQRKKYHIECQSAEDSSMIVRMFEYDAQIALDDGILSGSNLEVRFPNSSILYLRSTCNTPDEMQIYIITPGGNLTYPVKVLKLKSYTLEEIFQKQLFFLLPFYIFVHENKFHVYNKNRERLESLLKEFENIKNRLEDLTIKGIITEYIKCTIIDMTKKVVEHLAKNHSAIKEGVNSIMGGKVLEYEAKTILRAGISQGLSQERVQTLVEMVRDGFISTAEAAKRLELTVEEFQKLMNE